MKRGLMFMMQSQNMGDCRITWRVVVMFAGKSSNLGCKRSAERNWLVL